MDVLTLSHPAGCRCWSATASGPWAADLDAHVRSAHVAPGSAPADVVLALLSKYIPPHVTIVIEEGCDHA